MAKRIEIYKDRTCWVANFVGDMQVFNLFGSTQVPTPFGPSASGAAVLAEIQSRNPEYQVFLIDAHKAQYGLN